MVVETRIEVRGLKQLAAAFRAIDADLPKELRTGLLKVAEHVAGVARQGVPRISGRAAGSIRPRASTRGAGIAFGGSAAPYYPWLDFGGRVGRNRSIARPIVKGGRYIYPAIAHEAEAIAKGVDEAINDAARSAGFETEGHL